MTEQKVEIKGIENIKTRTAIRRIMDKGEEVGRELVTQVIFEGEVKGWGEPTSASGCSWTSLKGVLQPETRH